MSTYKLDPMLPGGISERDSFFDDGVETFDDGVPRPIEHETVERDPAEVERLLDIIEETIPEDVIELFEGRKKRKKEEAA